MGKPLLSRCNVSTDLAQEAGLGRPFRLKEVRNGLELAQLGTHRITVHLEDQQQTSNSKRMHDNVCQMAEYVHVE